MNLSTRIEVRDTCKNYEQQTSAMNNLRILMILFEVNKPVKIGLILGSLIVLWILYNSGDHDTRTVDDQSPSDQVQQPETEEKQTPAPDPRLRVDVYYECLCPDSRYFVLHHLMPTFKKLGSLMELHLWPYGKATSTQIDKGKNCFHWDKELPAKSFEC